LVFSVNSTLKASFVIEFYLRPQGQRNGLFVSRLKNGGLLATEGKFVARIEYRVLRGDKYSISTGGRDSHRTVSRRPVRAGVNKENANRR